MQKLDSIVDECVSRLDQATRKVRCWIPVRCELCGTWGHSSLGHHWLCDDCLTQLFTLQSSSQMFCKSERSFSTSSDRIGIQPNLFE